MSTEGADDDPEISSNHALSRKVISTLFGYANIDDHEMGMFIHSVFLKGIVTSIEDLVILDDPIVLNHVFKLLPVPAKGTKQKKLDGPDTILFKWFQRFSATKLRHNGNCPLDDAEWLKFTKKDFGNFRIEARVLDLIGKDDTSTLIPRSTPAPTSTTTVSSAAATDFTKSIKRSKLDYTILKEEKHWDQWHEGFVIQAKAHGLDNVLDHKYKPTSTSEIALFAEQQKFMMSVFHYVIKTNNGKTFVRDHLQATNAQKIYEKLVLAHHSSSTSARITAGSILTYLISTRYDKSWTSTSNDFILHWLNQARIYNEMVETPKQLHDSLLLTLLQQAVTSIDDLRSVETNAEILAAGGGGTTGDFEKYKTLLLATATRYERENIRGKTTRKQLINLSDRQDEQYVEQSYYDYEYTDMSEHESLDIDTPQEDYIQVNMAKSRFGRPRLRDMAKAKQQRAWVPRELFQELSEKQQEIIKEYNRRIRDSKDGVNIIQRNTKVNVIEEFKDARENEDNNDDDVKPDHEQACSTQNDTDQDQLLAYMSARNQDIHPTDIRRVLLTSRSATQYRRSVNTTRYRISHNARHSNQNGQLVDRGANGGVIGDNALVLEHCDKQSKVTLVGLDNHEMRGLPIVTAAGLCKTQHGPVIVIMNQYALPCRLKHTRTILMIVHVELVESSVSSRTTDITYHSQ